MSQLDLSCVVDRAAVDPGSTATLRVVLTVGARGAAVEGERAPIACALALDVSGSMAGEALEQLVASVEKLAELASPADRLGVAVFSDRASELVPLTPMDPAGKRLLGARARRLVATGQTNVEAGIGLAATLLRAAPEGARRSVLLLSDGVPNVGAATPDALGAVVRAHRPGLSVSSLGYGPHHHEDVLAAVATAGGGTYRFIPHPATCRRELAQALGAQGDVAADAIELTLVPGPRVEIVRVLGSHPSRFGAGLTLSLPDLEDGGRQRVALEVRLTGPIGATGELLRAEVRGRAARSREAIEARGVARVDVRAGDETLDHDAVRAFLLVQGEEVRARARSLADRQQFEPAAAVLRGFLAEIDASHGFVPDDGTELAELRETLLDEAVAYERRPSAEAYSVFRKQTMISQSLQDPGPAVRGVTMRAFASATAGLFPEAYLVVVRGPRRGERHRLGASNTIGRTRTAAIVVPSPSISRKHADVFALEGEFWICDLGTTNATLVNGTRLGTAPHKLGRGDVVELGDVALQYEQL